MPHFLHRTKAFRAVAHTFLFVILIAITCSPLYGQTPAKQWDKTFGSDGSEQQFKLISTTDGGYLVGGQSYANASGDKTENGRGGWDHWIVKLNTNGEKQWDRTIGGSDNDGLLTVIQTTDGGYLAGGLSYSSISGDKTENNKGGWDYWLVKLNSVGNKIWDKTIGGNSDDVLFSIAACKDGGYLLAGHSYSSVSADKSEDSKGDRDYWIVKVDSLGNKLWDKTIGGNAYDELREVVSTTDGGYLLSGHSSSSASGDKSEDSRGSLDYWVVRIDSAGNKLWDKTFGGYGEDRLYSAIPAIGGGYVLSGESISSASWDKSENSKGGWDYWVVSIDSLGNKVWDKTYGGSGDDGRTDITHSTSGGYLLAGFSISSASGDKSEDSKGEWDYWVIKVDSLGNKLWDKTFGGSGNDIGDWISVITTKDEGYLLAGESSSSASGDKSENSRGGADYWLVKLKEYPIHLQQGLVAHYPFNGNALDASGNENHGTVKGASLTSDKAGNPGNAYDFDGINDHILLPALNLASFSISFWIKQHQEEGTAYLVSRWQQGTARSYLVSLRADDRVNFSIADAAHQWDSDFHRFSPAATIPQDWTNITVSYDHSSGIRKIFVNGKLQATKQHEPIVPLASTIATYIGAHFDGSGLESYFRGQLDELYFYDRVLNEVEVEALFDAYQINLQQGLVAHYPFNGNADDKSGNENHGMVKGASLAADRFGNASSAYSFDGKDDFISVDDNEKLDMSKALTLSTWVYVRDSAARQQVLLSKWFPGQAYLLELQPDSAQVQSVQMQLGAGLTGDGDSLAFSEQAIEVGRWYHLVGVYDGAEIRLYQNGKQTGRYITSGSIPATVSPLFIGARLDTICIDSTGNIISGKSVLNGLLDDIRLYNRALNVQEILTLYHEQKAQPQQGLVAYYPFNGNANDASGNENHGTVNGATLTTDRFGNANSAYSFNGVDNYIWVNDNDILDITNAITLSAWVYVNNSTGDYQSIISKWFPELAYLLQLQPDGKLPQLVLSDGGGQYSVYSSDVSMDFGKWYHLVSVYTGSEVKIYQNGQQTYGFAVSRAIPATTAPLFIGAHNSADDRNPLNGKIDEVRIYNRALSEAEIKALYQESNISAFAIKVDSLSKARMGDTIQIAVSTSQLQLADSISSYQFTLTYDSTKLDYVSHSLSGTIAEGGLLHVNSDSIGLLRAGYIRATSLSGTGPLARFSFKVSGHGNSALSLSKFFYNTTPVTNLTSGVVSEIRYGDVDVDGKVLAYDATLTLQFSVGLDPLPTIDPLPWESWRIASADVDALAGVTANDAALILQKALGLIEQFPVEATALQANGRLQAEKTAVEIRVENKQLVFYAQGSLVGFNLQAAEAKDRLGEPQVLVSALSAAFNKQRYAVGLATAYPLADRVAFMQIPISGSGLLTLQLHVNGEATTVKVDLESGFVELSTAAIGIYPNPVTDKLIMRGLGVQAPGTKAVVEVYSMEGQLLQTSLLGEADGEIQVRHLPQGMYLLRVHTGSEVIVKRFVKQ